MQRRDALKKTALILGSAVAIPPLSSALKGCTPAEVDTYTPVFFSEEQFKTVSTMSDRILPKTDTPGAIDVGADRFIDMMLKDCYAANEQNQFLAGLDSFIAVRGEDNPFYELETAEKDAVLTPIDASEEVNDINRMFATLKELTLLGYFSSEDGIKSYFNYLPVPGRYEGCVTLAEGEKPWKGGRL